MSSLIRASSASLYAKARGMLRAFGITRCTRACQVDRELMAMRTDLTRNGGWSVAGIQKRAKPGLNAPATSGPTHASAHRHHRADRGMTGHCLGLHQGSSQRTAPRGATSTAAAHLP